jgi:hypothetical protein
MKCEKGICKKALYLKWLGAVKELLANTLHFVLSALISFKVLILGPVE